MGLLTILKKMKQKERELRLLMLYPPGRRSGQGSGAPPGRRHQAPPTGRRVSGRPARPNCPLCVTHVGTTNHLRRGPGRRPYHRLGAGEIRFQGKGVSLMAQRPHQVPQCRGEVGPGGNSDPTPLGLAQAWGLGSPGL